MKAVIHPEMHKDAKTTCSTCGAVYLIPCTMKVLTVETCRNCHPIYTGKQQKDLRGGRVDRFKKRAAATAAKKEKAV